MTKPFRSVIFIDLDATIMVNPFETAVWPQVMGEIARQAHLGFDEVYQMVAQENLTRQRDETCPAVKAMDWDDIVRTVSARLNVRLKVTCEALVRAHASSHSAVIDDGLAVLDRLRTHDRALVVATKGLLKYQQPVLNALRLTPFFNAVITPDTYQSLKRGAQFYGDWPAQGQMAVMVGDNYADDVETQGKRGIRTAWKRPDLAHEPTFANRDPVDRARLYSYRKHQTARADAILLSLRELPDLIERWEARLPRD